ncbi:hypothetical protein MIR68_008111 [Amoeboaphelidium protococcarum]|nr:hypothetical protein MIR68_008111 [Amoeboaphelidium protococcarum]
MSSLDSKYKPVAQDIQELMKKYKEYDDGHIGPLLVRLAWHASGTYSKHDQTGGSDGATMRFHVESFDAANNGLHIARSILEPIKLKHNWISYGDLWTLAAILAIHDMGGPVIRWRPGRADKLQEMDCPPNGRLPDATQGASHIRDVFYRMNFSDREIVALSGAHSLGRCHQDRSGFIGPWTYTPTRFSNQYYILLLNEKWKPVHKYANGPLQYENSDGELMMLPSDMALVEDKEFKKYVEMYAKDKALFFKDFAAAYEKLLELGFKRPSGYVNVCPVRQRM